MKEFPLIKNMSTIYDNVTAFYYIIISLIPFEHFILQEKKPRFLFSLLYSGYFGNLKLCIWLAIFLYLLDVINEEKIKAII